VIWELNLSLHLRSTKVQSTMLYIYIKHIL